jgi:hypothetical protein
MRTPGLAALFLCLLPIFLICLKLSSDNGWINSSSSLAVWTTLLMMVGSVAVLSLARLMKWHSHNRHRQ